MTLAMVTARVRPAGDRHRPRLDRPEDLQDAVDAAALVARQDLPDASTAYSPASPTAADHDDNALTGYGVTAASPNMTFECLSHAPGSTSGSGAASRPVQRTREQDCQPPPRGPQPSGVTTCNTVDVKETRP